jgi:serine/threonine protein kinase
MLVFFFLRFIATELCAGTLEGLVNGSYTGPTVGDSREVLRQITTGLDYIHRLNIVHGDLKPTNVLISHPVQNVSPVMKLTDFGLRHVVHKNETNQQNEQLFQPAHTKGWMCPFDKDDNTLFDLFSLGCLYFFTLFKGVHPFGETKEKRINRITARQPIILLTDQQLQAVVGFQVVWELINRMLDYNSDNRPTTSQILAHSYFSFNQFLCRTPEQFISGQNLTPPQSQSSACIPSASTPRLPSGEPTTKVMRTEQLRQCVDSYSHSTQGVFTFPANLNIKHLQMPTDKEMHR